MFLTECIDANKFSMCLTLGLQANVLGQSTDRLFAVFKSRGDFVQLSKGVSFMSLVISGHHLDVTPALHNYVSDKFERINRHFDQVGDIKVLLSIEKQREKERRQHAECFVHVKGHNLFAESAHADLYAAVDLLVDKMDHQIMRHKTKTQEYHHVASKHLLS